MSLCQECGRNEAQYTAIFNVNGQDIQKPVCEQCYNKLQLSVDDATKEVYHKLSESTKLVIYYARRQARERRHKFVLNDHLVYGIILENGTGYSTLESAGANVDQLKGQIDWALNSVTDLVPRNSGEEPQLSDEIKGTLKRSLEIINKIEFPEIEPEHILLSITEDRNSAISKNLKRNFNIDTIKLLRELESQLPESVDLVKKYKENDIKKSALEKYSRDLTKLAKMDKLDPCIGRADEIERVVHILSRRRKNNPVLVGEAGVGKTAIVEGLARRIVEADVPACLLTKRLLALDLNAMLAGTRFRGEFEERIKKVIDEVKAKSGEIILFIDELHNLIGAGAGGGQGMDAANILKPELARGELQCIGATTHDEYSMYIEHDKALERRFQLVEVIEPSVSEAKQILHGVQDRYANYHHVKINKDAIDAAVDLSVKYISNRYLPDKAIDLMDEAGAKVKLTAQKLPKEIIELKKEIIKSKREKKDVTKQEVEAKKLMDEWREKNNKLSLIVNKNDIAMVVSKWTKIPVTDLIKEEKIKLLHLEDKLHEKVVGQDQAIKSLCNAIRRARVGIKDPKRPIGSFIFAGKTGVGKTLIARTLAEYLFGSPEHFIKIDMSEYMEKHTVSRLIGAPPGYVGYDQGGQLVEHVRKHPYTVILLDEVEKAHPDIFNVLLQVMEDGVLTDGRARKADCRNAIIIMTTNIDATQRDYHIGFNSTNIETEEEYEKLKSTQEKALKNHFKPEFLNRVDDIIVFHNLNKTHMTYIVDLMIKELAERMKEQELKLQINKEVKELLVKEGFNKEYGARSLRRYIVKKIENPLAEELLTDKFKPKDTIIVKKEKEDILFDIEK